MVLVVLVFFFSSRRRHTSWPRDWSSDVCSSDLGLAARLPLTLPLPVGEAEPPGHGGELGRPLGWGCRPDPVERGLGIERDMAAVALRAVGQLEIGRASCREAECVSGAARVVEKN